MSSMRSQTVLFSFFLIHRFLKTNGGIFLRIRKKIRGIDKFFRDDSKGDIIFNWAETARTLLTGAS